MTLEELLAADTLLAHDEAPHGVPTAYDWQARPVFHAGGNPAGCTRLTPWGQVYVPETGSYDMRGAKAEIRDLKCWVLKRSIQQWVLTTLAPVSAQLYPEDFNVQVHPIRPAMVDTTSRPGSVMGAPAQVDGFGYLLHFYPNGSRVPIDPDDVCGVTVTCRIRLALVNQQLGAPRLLANVGADYWPDATSGQVRGVGQGRLKELDQAWRMFGFTTAPLVPLVLTDQSELR